MKITVSAQDLKETLGIAQNTLGTNQDITSHFIFTAEEAGVSVMACSPPRQFSKIPVIGATVQDKGSFSIEGKRLITATTVMNGFVEIEYNDEEKEVQTEETTRRLELSIVKDASQAVDKTLSQNQTTLKNMDKLEQLREENEVLKTELGALDDDFFADIEDLKFSYDRAIRRIGTVV